jgi:hypothetical protein
MYKIYMALIFQDKITCIINKNKIKLTNKEDMYNYKEMIQFQI